MLVLGDPANVIQMLRLSLQSNKEQEATSQLMNKQ